MRMNFSVAPHSFHVVLHYATPCFTLQNKDEDARTITQIAVNICQRGALTPAFKGQCGSVPDKITTEDFSRENQRDLGRGDLEVIEKLATIPANSQSSCESIRERAGIAGEAEGEARDGIHLTIRITDSATFVPPCPDFNGRLPSNPFLGDEPY